MSANRLTLENAVIFDATGRGPYEGHVMVAAGAIVDISDTKPKNATEQVENLGGRLLLPGLIDAHTHHGAIDHDVANQHRNYMDSYAALAIARRLADTLRQGITTARDAGGVDAGFRMAIEDGLIPGPRLRVSGRVISQTGGHGDVRRPVETGDPINMAASIGQVRSIADGPDEVRRSVREQLRRGADQIKVMASGGVASPTDAVDSTQYTAAELAAAVEEAAAVGTYVLAHAYTATAVRRCVEAGVRSIEHGNLIDRPTAELMAKQGTFLVSTMTVYERAARITESVAHKDAFRRKLQQVGDHAADALKIAMSAGVQIGSGSDLLGPIGEGEMVLEIAAKASVIGIEAALIATTATNAKLMGLNSQLGTVEVGKIADLAVFDLACLEQPRLLATPPHLVIKDGSIVARNGVITKR